MYFKLLWYSHENFDHISIQFSRCTSLSEANLRDPAAKRREPVLLLLVVLLVLVLEEEGLPDLLLYVRGALGGVEVEVLSDHVGREDEVAVVRGQGVERFFPRPRVVPMWSWM